ncbi:MAG: hypothetical protein WCW02_04215 [Candidatus Buchananbacteria bacterium]
MNYKKSDLIKDLAVMLGKTIALMIGISVIAVTLMSYFEPAHFH